MSKYLVNDTSLTSIADAIRTKGGTSNSLVFPEGFVEAIDDISGGSWTKVAETSYQVSTTGTSAATVNTWETGHSELWTSNKIVYVRIRDTAGKRSGYFYGTDTWFMNMHPANNSTSTTATSVLTAIWRYSSSGEYYYRYGYATTGYGVYADTFYNDGRVRIQSRYNSTYSLTIDGTYKVEIYLLDPAGGVPIFE